MTQLFVAAPVVDLVRQSLVARLPDYGFNDVTVSETAPEPLSGLFVRIESGADIGITDVVVDHWSLVLQVSGPRDDRDTVERLAAFVPALLRDLEGHSLGGTFVYESTVGQFSHFPDPDNRRPRWVGSARITCRALIL